MIPTAQGPTSAEHYLEKSLNAILHAADFEETS